jgi:hypothetical protein
MTRLQREVREVSPYTQVLGQHFEQLAPVLSRLHSEGERCLSGTLNVRGANRVAARFLLWLARMPRPISHAPCNVRIVPRAGGEVWYRRMGDQTLFSLQQAKNRNVIVERIGWLSLHLRLQVRRNQLWIRSSTTKLCGVRLPAVFGIWVAAHERAISPDTFRCSVRVHTPLLGALLSYSGVLRLEKPESPPLPRLRAEDVSKLEPSVQP